eukprot:m.149563 g.149563  ORF g.149563 m.149563 type:complete len:56 (-) comp17822_c0_seq3:410-577(-)
MIVGKPFVDCSDSGAHAGCISRKRWDSEVMFLLWKLDNTSERIRVSDKNYIQRIF